jgi:predicted RNase H-like HicB family nuclease
LTDHEHRLQYHCHKGATGEYIGQFVELPGVIVHAPTKEAIKTRLMEALEAYFDAFPAEHERISRESGDKPIVDEVLIRH